MASKDAPHRRPGRQDHRIRAEAVMITGLSCRSKPWSASSRGLRHHSADYQLTASRLSVLGLVGISPDNHDTQRRIAWCPGHRSSPDFVAQRGSSDRDSRSAVHGPCYRSGVARILESMFLTSVRACTSIRRRCSLSLALRKLVTSLAAAQPFSPGSTPDPVLGSVWKRVRR
jgi:hypothetical protein